jgi:hypothetical protein
MEWINRPGGIILSSVRFLDSVYLERAISSVDRALVSGTKGRGFDPRIALHWMRVTRRATQFPLCRAGALLAGDGLLATRCAPMLLLLTALVACHGVPDPGRLSLLPAELVAGRPGELRLVYQVGRDGMHRGDALRIELPTGWYTISSCPMVDNRGEYQSHDPEAGYYFGVVSRHPEAEFFLATVPGRRIDGLGNRFISTLELHVKKGGLDPETEVEILVGGRRQGGAFVVPRAGGAGWIQAEYVPAADPDKRVRMPPVPVQVNAGPPAELVLVVPSIGRVGETLRLRVSAIDEYYNPCASWTGPVWLESDPAVKGLPGTILPASYGLSQEGSVSIPFRVESPGRYTIRGRAEGLGPAESNPVLILPPGAPGERLFWGDLHSHSRISKDAMGDRPFEYARDVSFLDFYSLTEHHTLFDPGYPQDVLLPKEDWDWVKEQVRDFYQPDSFVTLLAFENSASSPSGHHNVYYPTDEGPLLHVHQLDSTWEHAQAYDPCIIQHHTGIIWRTNSVPAWLAYLFALAQGDYVDWEAYKEVPRQALEIYSLHGQSEYVNPFDALAYENCDLTLPRDGDRSRFSCQTGYSMIGRHYAQDAWRSGLKLGTVAGSDDHQAQPGKRGGGLTAVYCQRLTREEIFEAIRHRHTYATTGDRIILSFSINGAPMGSEITTTGAPRIEVDAVGTGDIEYVQVMRLVSGENYWRVAAQVLPRAREVHFEERDTSFCTDSIYYVRLEQEGLVHGRPVRAWSSPIWVFSGR